MLGFVSFVKDLYANCTPPMFRMRISKIRNYINSLVRDRILIKKQCLKNDELAANLKGRDVVKVVFLAQIPSIWKYDKLYSLMKQDSHFEPIVLVCPLLQQRKEMTDYYMQLMYNELKNKGYNVVNSYDENTHSFLPIRDLNPDIIFHTRPYQYLIPDEYYITNLSDYLNCSTPYGIMVNTDKHHYSSLFHNLLWINFADTIVYKEIAEKISYLKGRNVVVCGYPGCDLFLDKLYKPNDPWKIADRNVIRIIWAPHHSPNEKYSVFFDYCDYFLFLADRYKSKIQIAFKPHPLLKSHLYGIRGWGKKRTDEYYEQWSNLPNGQLIEGNYVDLFITSDALIHYSRSFMVEYLYTLKPVMYLYDKKFAVKKELNRLALEALEYHYSALDKCDIENFIQKVLIEKQDFMCPLRRKFFETYLLPNNTNNASLNILNEIKKYMN